MVYLGLAICVIIFLMDSRHALERHVILYRNILKQYIMVLKTQ